MDLAEIRKKARQQAEQDHAQPPVETTLPAELPEPDQPEGEEFTLPEVAAPPATGLQKFFPDLALATEEDYIQGLSGKDKSVEIDRVRWLTFLLGDEEYALSLEVVLELIKPRNYTDLPKVPDYVKGILSLRGEVVPVIDLRQRLKLGCGEESGFQRVIVCQGKEQSIGLLVDRITQVVSLPIESIEPAPLMLTDGEMNFVEGVGRYQGRMLIQLNPNEVLTI